MQHTVGFCILTFSTVGSYRLPPVANRVKKEHNVLYAKIRQQLYLYHHLQLISVSNVSLIALTLYDPGGGFKSPPLRFFALTHLILELQYCALGTFPKK